MLEQRRLRDEYVNPGKELRQHRCRSSVPGVSEGRARGMFGADRPSREVVLRGRERDDDITDGQWPHRIILGDFDRCRESPRLVAGVELGL